MIGHLGGEARAALALGAAGAHERAAHVAHDGLHVGEVDVDDAVLRDEIADALDGLVEDLVRLAEGVDEGEVLVAEREELLVRDRDERVDVLARACARPSSARRARWRPSKRNGLVTTPTVSAPSSRASCAMTGAAPVPVPPPMPAVTKTMSAPLMSSLMRCHVLERGLAALLGIGAGAEAARDARADVQLRRRGVRVERLRVGVDDDELDAFEAEVDHRVDGVAAGAAAADDLDPRLVVLRLVGELDRETHDRPPGPSTASSRSTSTARSHLPGASSCDPSMSRIRTSTAAHSSTRDSERCLDPLPESATSCATSLDRRRRLRRCGCSARHRARRRASRAARARRIACAPYCTRPTPVAYCGPVHELRDALDAGREPEAHRHAEDLLGELGHALEEHGAAGEDDARARAARAARCPRCACGRRRRSPRRAAR